MEMTTCILRVMFTSDKIGNECCSRVMTSGESRVILRVLGSDHMLCVVYEL